MSTGSLLKVGATFEGYRIMKEVPGDCGSLGGLIQCFQAVRTSELRLDAMRFIYCTRPASPAGESDVVAAFPERLERLKGLRLPELPEVETGGFAQGLLWVAVQDIRGDTLKSIIMSQDITEPWPLPMCLQLVSTIARVFKAASEHGIFHYAFTPFDVVCTRDLELRKITGMGILQLFGRTGRVPGTTAQVLYTAPEQIVKGGVVGPKTDVYFVGLLFYELCTHDMAFASAQGTVPSGDLLIKCICMSGPEPLSSKIGCPEFVDKLMQRLLPVTPRRRADWQVIIDEARATAERLKQLLGPTELLATQDEEKARDGDNEERSPLKKDEVTSEGDELAPDEWLKRDALAPDAEPASVRPATVNAPPKAEPVAPSEPLPVAAMNEAKPPRESISTTSTAAQREAGRSREHNEKTEAPRRPSRRLWGALVAGAVFGVGAFLLGGFAIQTLAERAPIAMPTLRMVRPVLIVDSQPPTESEARSEALRIAPAPLLAIVREKPSLKSRDTATTWEESCVIGWAECDPAPPELDE